MTAFINHLSFEFRTGIRNKQLLLMNYLFPLGFYLMMGFVMAGINPMFLDSMTPAMVVFAVLAATLLGIPDPLVNARENGIFRSYKINGVPSFSILIIPALTTISNIGLLFLPAFGSLWYETRTGGNLSAGYLAMLFPLCWMQYQRERGIFRTLNLVVMAVTPLVIIVTASRTALVSATSRSGLILSLIRWYPWPR